MLRTLNDQWQRQQLGRKLVVRYVTAAEDAVVDEDSAKGVFGNDALDTIAGGHRSCVKPRASEDYSFQLFRRLICDTAPLLQTDEPPLLSRLEELGGRWLSEFQRKFPATLDWLREQVNIGVQGDELAIRNVADKATEVNYAATGRLTSDGREICGTWRDTRRAASISGSFVLLIDPLGTALYGIASGKDDTDQRLLTGWLLGRTESDLARARDRLSRALRTGPVTPATTNLQR